MPAIPLTRRAALAALGALALPSAVAVRSAQRASRGQVPRHRGRRLAVASQVRRSDRRVGATRASRRARPSLGGLYGAGRSRAARPWWRGSTRFISRRPAAGPGAGRIQDTIAGALMVRGARGGVAADTPLRAIASYYPNVRRHDPGRGRLSRTSRGACAIVRRLGAKRARALTARVAGSSIAFEGRLRMGAKALRFGGEETECRRFP